MFKVGDVVTVVANTDNYGYFGQTGTIYKEGFAKDVFYVSFSDGRTQAFFAYKLRLAPETLSDMTDEDLANMYREQHCIVSEAVSKRSEAAKHLFDRGFNIRWEGQVASFYKTETVTKKV